MFNKDINFQLWSDFIYSFIPFHFISFHFILSYLIQLAIEQQNHSQKNGGLLSSQGALKTQKCTITTRYNAPNSAENWKEKIHKLNQWWKNVLKKASKRTLYIHVVWFKISFESRLATSYENVSDWWRNRRSKYREMNPYAIFEVVGFVVIVGLNIKSSFLDTSPAKNKTKNKKQKTKKKKKKFCF